MNNQWQKPDEFIPERFDPKSPLFLTPDGKKRHPLAFNPFLGGRRVCAGKSFAEIVMKLLTATLMSKFEFEFVNEKDKMKKDHYI